MDKSISQGGTDQKTSDKSFERSLLLYPEVDTLLKHFTDNKNFTIVLDKFKNISADIFACHNFFEDFPKESYLYHIFALIKANHNSTLKDFLAEVKKTFADTKFTKQEVYVSILIILYLFLQEVSYGPSFFFIRETEKVDFQKDLFKFDNHFFSQLDSSLSKDEMADYLTVDGEVPYNNVRFMIFYVICYEFFVKDNSANLISEYFETFKLWKGRVLYLHNKMLKEPGKEIQDELFSVLESFKLDSILQNEKEVDESQKEILKKNNNIIKGMLKLEQSYYNLKYYKYNKSENLTEEAKELFNLKISLTGKLGRRTKFQDFDIPVLVVESNSSTLEESKVAENNKQNTGDIKEEQVDENIPKSIILDAENPLLEKPNITDDSFLQSAYTELSLFDQMYVTSLINILKVSMPDEDLLREVILTYTNKSLEKSYDWLVYSKILLQKALAEDKRSKTIERALLQIQSLCDQFNDRTPVPYNRLRYYFVIDYPFIWNMKKHYAEMFMNYGAVLTAFDIFNELNMYEECIQCLYMAGKNERALEYAEEVLKKKALPGVYCVLGEIQNKEEYFHKALEVSNNRYTRAYRCLGKYHFSVKNDLEKALNYYYKALDINPLFPNIWFTVGCINLRLNKWEDACSAFSKCVSIDESNSEGWANLGLAFAQCKKTKQALKSLDEGLKRSRNNWKICENLMYIAIDAEDLGKLIYTVNHLFTLDKFERIKPSVFYSLTRIFLSICHSLSTQQSDYYKMKIYDIFEKFSIKDGVTPEVWDLYAFFVESVEVEVNKDKLSDDEREEFYHVIIEIRLKQARSLMIADLWEKDEKSVERVAKVVAKIAEEAKRIKKEERNKDVAGFLNSINTKIEKFYKWKQFEETNK